MKDRQGSPWAPRLLVPLVVGLQVGLFGLAMHVWNPPTRHDAPALPATSHPAGTLEAETAVALADRDADGVPSLLDLGQQPPRWLPPLTDRTRMLLTSFEPPPEQTELSTGPKLGVPAAATSGDASQPGDPAGAAGIGRLDPPEAALGAAVMGPEPEEARPPQTARPPATLPAVTGPALTSESAAPPRAASEQARPVEPAAPGVPSLPPVSAVPTEPQPVVTAPRAAIPLGRLAQAGSQPAAQPAEALRRSWERLGERSMDLELIARQADMHTRRAFELASRGAYFSARSEFIMALRLVAQGLDTEQRSGVHSRALALGLRALREAEDFAPDGSRLEADLNMPGIIDGHRTPVLKDYPAGEITPLLALQRYFTFAQEQLAIAAGREVAGSMALQGLGKLHAVLADRHVAGAKAAESKAVAFYQGALLVYPQNYMASNDLGVLLARAGHYSEARMAMVHSLSIRPHAIGWRNLAVVHRQSGQMELALRAAQQWQVYRRAEIAQRGGGAAGSNRMVRWVTAERFGQSYAATPEAPRTAPAVARSATPRANRPSRPPARQAANRGWSARVPNYRK